MEYVEQLFAIHSQVQTGKGRRHHKEAIHRAGVVLIVAAWQSYIEKLSNEVLDLIEARLNRKKTPTWVKASFSFRRPAVRQSIGALNTPNSQNVQRLLDWSFGFDPKPFWVFKVGGRKWEPQEFCNRTDDWLRIRHTIAHGNDLPGNLPWLKNASGNVRLTLGLLRECERHFWKLAELTDTAMSDFLLNEYRIKTRWDEDE